MAIIKNKQGFVFTFLSLFIVMMIYLFAQINMDQRTFSLYDDFEKSRIESIDQEINYFKTSYVHDAYKVSIDSTIRELINYSYINPAFYDSYKDDYSRFNDLIYEGMINGSFDGNDRDALNGRTITEIIAAFEEAFNEQNKGDFTFNSSKIIVYEETPFYISLQADFNISVTLKDNLTSWYFNDSVEIQRPVYGYFDSTHAISFDLGENSPTLESVENRYSSNINWTLEILNETIDRQLATTYRDPSYKYTLGTSFIRGIFGDFTGPYATTNGFWSFDYDSEEGGVYDSSQLIENGKFLGNSKLLMDFDENDGSETPDKSAYENNGTLNGNVDCNVVGVFGNGCEFDGVDDYIQNDVVFGETLNSSFTFSFWVKTTSNSGGTLIGKTAGGFVGSVDSNIHMIMNSTGQVGWRLEYNGSNNEDTFLSQTPINDGEWHHVVGVRDGWDFRIYIDGQLDEEFLKEDYYVANGEKEYNSPLRSTSSLDIGAYRPLSTPGAFFNGVIDEVGVYSKALSSNEIALAYEDKQIKDLGYQDSYHGKGVEFDGIDDYIELDVGTTYDDFFRNENFTIEIWFTPQKDAGDIFYYKDGLSISYNITAQEIYVSDDNGYNKNIDLELSKEYPNYLVVNYESGVPPVKHAKGNPPGFKGIEVYHNTKQILNETINLNGGASSNETFFIGKANPASPINSNFGGVIDEFRITTGFFSIYDVMKRYYNFKSLAKGCCNYIIPLNPHETGFNTTTYNDQIPYSTTAFARHHIQNDTISDVTLYNVTNITTSQTDERYYNFLVDSCQILIYDIFSYSELGNSAELVVDGSDDGDCLELIRRGIY